MRYIQSIMTLLVVLLVGSIIWNYYLYNNLDSRDCPVEELNCPEVEEQAMLYIEMYDWGTNEYDENELVFQYWIMNYGDLEAKNIRVNCKLFDSYDNLDFSSIQDYGNLASRSAELWEFAPKKSSSLDTNGEYSAICHVESCDNCEILYKRIPKLIESYGVNY